MGRAGAAPTGSLAVDRKQPLAWAEAAASATSGLALLHSQASGQPSQKEGERLALLGLCGTARTPASSYR